MVNTDFSPAQINAHVEHVGDGEFKVKVKTNLFHNHRIVTGRVDTTSIPSVSFDEGTRLHARIGQIVEGLRGVHRFHAIEVMKTTLKTLQIVQANAKSASEVAASACEGGTGLSTKKRQPAAALTQSAPSSPSEEIDLSGDSDDLPCTRDAAIECIRSTETTDPSSTSRAQLEVVPPGLEVPSPHPPSPPGQSEPDETIPDSPSSPTSVQQDECILLSPESPSPQPEPDETTPDTSSPPANAQQGECLQQPPGRSGAKIPSTQSVPDHTRRDTSPGMESTACRTERGQSPRPVSMPVIVSKSTQPARVQSSMDGAAALGSSSRRSTAVSVGTVDATASKHADPPTSLKTLEDAFQGDVTVRAAKSLLDKLKVVSHRDRPAEALSSSACVRYARARHATMTELFDAAYLDRISRAFRDGKTKNQKTDKVPYVVKVATYGFIKEPTYELLRRALDAKEVCDEVMATCAWVLKGFRCSQTPDFMKDGGDPQVAIDALQEMKLFSPRSFVTAFRDQQLLTSAAIYGALNAMLREVSCFFSEFTTGIFDDDRLVNGDAVARAVRQITDHDFVIIPVNFVSMCHWGVITVCKASRRIETYDPKGIVRGELADIVNEAILPACPMVTDYTCSVASPHQSKHDQHNCGVFVLLYVECTIHDYNITSFPKSLLNLARFRYMKMCLLDDGDVTSI